MDPITNSGLDSPPECFSDAVALERITTQEAPGGWDAAGGRVTMVPPLTTPQDWDFLDPFAPKTDAPSKDSLAVTVNDATVAIERVGFRRRTHYAKKGGDDLRISHSIYLLLEQNIPIGASVSVTDAEGAGKKWLENLDFSTQSLANRYSPMIHVNQIGYGATWEGHEVNALKKGYVHGFFGDLGWLLADETRGEWVVASVTLEDGPSLEDAIPIGLPLEPPFEIINAETSAVDYQSPKSPYTVRGDSRWPTYNGVLEMDFSDLVTSGNYRLRIPGFGASMPFLVGEAMPKQLTRALGFVTKQLPQITTHKNIFYIYYHNHYVNHRSHPFRLFAVNSLRKPRPSLKYCFSLFPIT